jgi:hypothetical protein
MPYSLGNINYTLASHFVSHIVVCCVTLRQVQKVLSTHKELNNYVSFSTN